MVTEKKEHAFITIEKDLKSGKIPRVVLLCGSEEYLIEWYTQVLTRRYVSDACALDLVRLEGDASSMERITEGLGQVSLMSGARWCFCRTSFLQRGSPCGGFRNPTAKRWRRICPR